MMKLYPHKHSPQLQLSPQQIERRLKFAHTFLNHHWDHTLFVDEKKFALSTLGNRKNSVVWDEIGKRNTKDIPKYHQSINAWAGVSSQGKTSIYLFAHSLDADKYINVLETQMITAAHKMFGATKWELLQDNAPFHRAAKVNHWLSDHHVKFFTKEQYPANSPDLNIIENVWSVLANNVDARDPKNLHQLKQYIIEEWDNIPMEQIQTLVGSMRRRLKAVIKAKGQHTDY